MILMGAYRVIASAWAGGSLGLGLGGPPGPRARLGGGVLVHLAWHKTTNEPLSCARQLIQPAILMETSLTWALGRWGQDQKQLGGRLTTGALGLGLPGLGAGASGSAGAGASGSAGASGAAGSPSTTGAGGSSPTTSGPSAGAAGAAWGGRRGLLVGKRGGARREGCGDAHPGLGVMFYSREMNQHTSMDSLKGVCC
jgi:hypothetical protein